MIKLSEIYFEVMPTEMDRYDFVVFGTDEEKFYEYAEPFGHRYGIKFYMTALDMASLGPFNKIVEYARPYLIEKFEYILNNIPSAPHFHVKRTTGWKFPDDPYRINPEEFRQWRIEYKRQKDEEALKLVGEYKSLTER